MLADTRTLLAALDTIRAVDLHPDDALALGERERARLVTEVDTAIRDLTRARRLLAATPRICQVCGSEFLGRADARYCGDAHRQQAHRGETGRFVRASAEGVTECGIAYTATAVIPVASAAHARAMGLEPTAEELQREAAGSSS